MPLSLNFRILANLLKGCCIPPFYGLLERKVTFEVAIGPILKYSIRPKEFKNAIKKIHLFVRHLGLCLHRLRVNFSHVPLKKKKNSIVL